MTNALREEPRKLRGHKEESAYTCFVGRLQEEVVGKGNFKRRDGRRFS